MARRTPAPVLTSLVAALLAARGPRAAMAGHVGEHRNRKAPCNAPACRTPEALTRFERLDDGYLYPVLGHTKACDQFLTVYADKLTRAAMPGTNAVPPHLGVHGCTHSCGRYATKRGHLFCDTAAWKNAERVPPTASNDTAVPLYPYASACCSKPGECCDELEAAELFYVGLGCATFLLMVGMFTCWWRKCLCFRESSNQVAPAGANILSVGKEYWGDEEEESMLPEWDREQAERAKKEALEEMQRRKTAPPLRATPVKLPPIAHTKPTSFAVGATTSEASVPPEVLSGAAMVASPPLPPGPMADAADAEQTWEPEADTHVESPDTPSAGDAQPGVEDGPSASPGGAIDLTRVSRTEVTWDKQPAGLENASPEQDPEPHDV